MVDELNIKHFPAHGKKCSSISWIAAVARRIMFERILKMELSISAQKVLELAITGSAT